MPRQAGSKIFDLFPTLGSVLELDSDFLQATVLCSLIDPAQSSYQSYIIVCKTTFFWLLLTFFPEYDLEPCQDPGTPRFGWHTGSRFGIGDSVAFYCNTGYRLQGMREIVCLGGGRRMWSAPLPRCVGTWSAVFIPFSFLSAFCTISHCFSMCLAPRETF